MIKRYYATKDNTITNAFEENLTTRGTGSNMGASDILEVFSIYSQASSGSVEKARTIIEFDTSQISSDREAGTIPRSGSVSFYLKLTNAPHSSTVPRDYVLDVRAVSGSWEEGYGLDMEYYEDVTNDGLGSNWINANGSPASATGTLILQGGANEAAMDAQSFTLTDTAGNSQVFTFDFDSDINTGGTIGFSSATTTTASIQAIKRAINSISALGITAGTPVAAGDSDSQMTLTLTQDSIGRAGNTDIDVSAVAHLTSTNFTNGDGKWVSQGGDIYTDASSSFTQTFTNGLEDLEVDVTPLVEQWVNSSGNILGSKLNNGFMIRMSSTYEDASRSYYTKRFFGRDSEFFFKRPVIEARYDDTIKDNRGRFFLKDSILATNGDNTNTLYYYNYVRNRLRNIPGRTDHSSFVYVKFFTGSATLPGSEIKVQDAAGNSEYAITGGYHDTGIYSCSVMITGSHSTIYDVWYRSSTSHVAHQSFFTGSISTNTHAGLSYTNTENYVLSMPNLKSEYKKGQSPKLRMYARGKDWSPNIHTLASRSSVASLLFESASYQIKRSVDDLVIMEYGTGSLNHTGMSYDISGNYFYLDTKLLESGYTYDIYYSIFNEDSETYIEQPYKFRFRVVD